MIAPYGSLALQALLGAGVGVLSGLGYFVALRWNATLFEAGATPRALAVLLVRFALLAGVFVLLAKWGALALLAGLGGLLFARRAVLRRLGGLS
jgi:F1F0 ATPase subunit 2